MIVLFKNSCILSWYRKNIQLYKRKEDFSKVSICVFQAGTENKQQCKENVIYNI